MEYLSLLVPLVDAGKVGGWVRGFVGSLLAVYIARHPALAEYVDPITQAAIATAVSGFVVGVWSHFAKYVQDGGSAKKAGSAAIVAFAVIVLWPTSGRAADLPSRAAPYALQNPFTGPAKSGIYWFVGTTSGAQQTSVNGSTLLVPALAGGNVMATGQSVDVGLGYIWGNASVGGFLNWYRAQVKVSYQNITGGTSVPGGSTGWSSRWATEQEFDAGADIVQAILNYTGLNNPFPAFQPQLPSNIAVASGPKQYVGFVSRVFGIDGNFFSAEGSTVGWAFGPKTGFLWQTVGKDGKPNGGALDIFAEVVWNTRGATFSNVFANNKTVVVSPGVGAGTGYFLGSDLAFGVGN